MMSEKMIGGVHWSFWVICIVTLIWNVMGAMNYLMQMNAEMVATYPESHRAIIEARPAWATGGFAIAVFGGALGCFLLLFKKSAAFYLFIASLLGVIVATAHTLTAVDLAGFSVFEIFMMMLMPLVVAGFLIWYTKFVQGKGWVG